MTARAVNQGDQIKMLFDPEKIKVKNDEDSKNQNLINFEQILKDKNMHEVNIKEISKYTLNNPIADLAKEYVNTNTLAKKSVIRPDRGNKPHQPQIHVENNFEPSFTQEVKHVHSNNSYPVQSFQTIHVNDLKSYRTINNSNQVYYTPNGTQVHYDGQSQRNVDYTNVKGHQFVNETRTEHVKMDNQNPLMSKIEFSAPSFHQIAQSVRESNPQPNNTLYQRFPVNTEQQSKLTDVPNMTKQGNDDLSKKVYITTVNTKRR